MQSSKSPVFHGHLLHPLPKNWNRNSKRWWSELGCPCSWSSELFGDWVRCGLGINPVDIARARRKIWISIIKVISVEFTNGEISSYLDNSACLFLTLWEYWLYRKNWHLFLFFHLWKIYYKNLLYHEKYYIWYQRENYATERLQLQAVCCTRIRELKKRVFPSRARDKSWLPRALV